MKLLSFLIHDLLQASQTAILPQPNERSLLLFGRISEVSIPPREPHKTFACSRETHGQAA